MEDSLKRSSPVRTLSVPAKVAAAGGIDEWNSKNPSISKLSAMLDEMCKATTVDEAIQEVFAINGLSAYGASHMLWSYMYMRTLAAKNPNLYYQALLTEPRALLPIVYTPTVGEACQKFGLMPLGERGCFVSISQKGNVKAVLAEYAERYLPKAPADRGHPYECDCIVFSDGGRILGLGDLGVFGMGIPMGKLDLYTVCGGLDPSRTMPLIIDAGIDDWNSAGIPLRSNDLYFGSTSHRVMHKSPAGTNVNSAYYGGDSIIRELFGAARELFGKGCLLQFEDFDSNDAFPLLEEYRHENLTYNDDIQGTAAVTVAGIMGALKIRDPGASIKAGLSKMRFLFFGAGSANLGTIGLLREAGVPADSIICTNSRGVIWVSADGSEGNYRNDDQKAVAVTGKPQWPDIKDLVTVINNFKPDCLVGAVGRAPDAFTKDVIDAMCASAAELGVRPIVFALSNPKTQAEITAEKAYDYSDGKVIYGSGTAFPPHKVGDKIRDPGQVNNFFIFPGVSFGAVACQAKCIPESLFLIAAEAVADSLDEEDVAKESVVPNQSRIREVSLNVAAAICVAAEKMGIAQNPIKCDPGETVQTELKKRMWVPPPTDSSARL